MPGKTAQITLGEAQYTIHAFRLGELEEITRGMVEAGRDGTQYRIPFVVLEIAMRRAEPKLEGAFQDIEADTDQVKAGAIAALKLAGLEDDDSPPDKGAPPSP